MKIFLVKIKFASFTLAHFFLLPYVYYRQSSMGVKEFHDFVYTFAVRWGKKILGWMKAEVTVVGLGNVPEEPVVVVSNHQAGFDIPLLFAYLTNKPSFIAKIELSRIPFFAAWMRMLGCLFIDRSSPRKGLESFKKAAEMIKNGQSVIIFPEGTRRPVIIPFKKGSFKLPQMAGVPILPVTIVGTEKITGNYKAGRTSRVTLVIDKPVDIASLDKEKQNTIHDDVRNLISMNFDKYSEADTQ